MTAPDFEEYWSDLRGGIPKRKRAYSGLQAAVTPLRAWVEKPDESPLRVIPGEERAAVLAQFEAELPPGVMHRWVSPWGGSVTQTFVRSLRDFSTPPTHRDRQDFAFALPHPMRNPGGWDLLWGLGARNTFVIEEPLRGMTNRRVSRLAELYRALSEVRFDVKERKDWQLVQEEINEIGRWLEGAQKETPFLSRVLIRRPLDPVEQLDTMLFLLTLAKQNHLIEDVFLALDNLESASPEEAEDLNNVILAVSRWAVIGSPLRLLIGWDAKSKSSLRKLHPRLAQHVRDGMKWVKAPIVKA